MSRRRLRTPGRAAAALTAALALAAGLLVGNGAAPDARAAEPTAPEPRAAAPRGADVPYTTYEAEDAATDGTVLGPSRTYLEPASEASGRRAVVLAETGRYVEFTLTAPADALNLRYSLPDSADGTGLDATLSLHADGEELEPLQLTSKYAWVYGGYPYTNDPSQGEAHRFFDETRTLLDETLPAGTVLRLEKGPADTAASYTVDLLEAETAPEPATAPDTHVSATDLGVTPDDGQDDTAALNDALRTAREQGKGLWLPPGTYDVSDHVNLTGDDLRGAGVWHTVLRGKGIKGGLFGRGGTSGVRDLTIDGDTTVRDDAAGHAAIEGDFGENSVISDVWIRHTKVGLWIDGPTTGLEATRLRVRDTFADGVNLHKGTRDTVVSDSTFRGTGDDALAMYSEEQAVTDCVFRGNTVQLPLLANGAAVYGGSGNRVEDNDISDTVNAAAGIAVSTRDFGPGPLPFTGTTTVSGNTLTRVGGHEPNWDADFGALWVYADRSDITTPVVLTDNTVRDSTYSGLLVSGQRTVDDLTVEDTEIATTGSYGIEIAAAGGGTFSGVTVTGTAGDGLNLTGDFRLARGEGNSGW
ncbi:right-handed parallel beta-helix repeat-containing protein [Streptomyces phytohabitans]|uniref:right-handed parallel beta-helix repeat-containing protein n=1 Tax=Streptomyces phytohabitans TaxID=1150371 RepID=UPI00345BE79E